jgi:hypothetical protein
MTDLAGMHSYFWLVSPRMKASVQDDIPYTDQALKQDLLRVRNAWEDSQASRERDAIYSYLTAVFNLVAWWAAEKRALERGHKALRLRHINPFENEEPFAVVIRCTGWQLSWLLGLHSIPPCPCGQPSQIRAKRERRRRVDEE